ncbi:MAG: hypothetical protein MJY93_01480 [Fibrobacter sp.]|nr:hypothetical protein [Fibrobacter sp.]
MARYLIKDIKCEINGHVGPCGPGPEWVVAEVELQAENGETRFLDVTEVENCGIMFNVGESLYETLLEGDFTPENIPDPTYESEEYKDFYNDKNSDMYQEFRLLVYVIRSDWNEIDRCKKDFIGKYVDEIDIPKCDAELAAEKGCSIWELDEDEEES